MSEESKVTPSIENTEPAVDTVVETAAGTEVSAPAPRASTASTTQAGAIAANRGGTRGGRGRGRGRDGEGGGNSGGGGGGGNYLESSRNKGEKRDEAPEFIEKVVFINRCAKVVKGGRRFSFSALVVVGDGKGKVGIGFGKANEVAESIRKGNEDAKKNMEFISLNKTSIPHEVLGEFGGSKVLLKPASAGTGLIAGGGARAIVEAVGIKDILTKSLGSSNPSNVVKATLAGLRQLSPREEIFRARGKQLVSKES
ncbi:MAG: 30S ribosomal protein S5 [Blastochloris sp.]|nr:30S ribosomal protein S5 [Blastochloris sp.]